MSKPFALALLLAVGCDRCDGTAISLEDVELLGYRELARRSDGVLVYVFDEAWSPRLRIDAPPNLELALVLATADEERRVAESGRKRRDDRTLISYRLPTETPAMGDLTLVARDAQGRPLQSWPARWDGRPSQRPEVRAVVELRETDRAAAIERAMASSDPWVCSEAVATYRFGNQLDAAITATMHCAEVAGAAGLVTEQSRHLRAAAYMLRERRRYRESIALLDRAEREDREVGNARGLLLADYYRGTIGWVTGDYRAARLNLAQAIDLGWRLGYDADAANAQSALALWYLEHGLVDRALEQAELAVRVLSRPESSPVWHAVAEEDLAWVLASAACARDDARCLARARSLQSHARDVFERSREAGQLAIARLNLSYLSFLEGDLEAAKSELLDLDPAALGAQEVFRLILSAEVALAEGSKAEAVEKARAAVDAARAAREVDYRWRAVQSLGRALEASGERDQAIEQYLHGVDLVEESVRNSPIREGRAAFVHERRGLYQDAVALLLEGGRVAEAFAIADRSQSRVLRDLELDLRASRLDEEQRARFLELLEVGRRGRDELARAAAQQSVLVGTELAKARARQAQLAREQASTFESMVELLDQHATPAVSTAPAPRLEDHEALIEVFEGRDASALLST